MAQRQLRMSVGVAAVLGCAIVATLIAVRPGDDLAKPARPAMEVHTPLKQTADMLVSFVKGS